MLKAGLYQQYLMGSRIIILESGSQSTQAGQYTRPLDAKAQYPHRNYSRDDEPVKNYRREMTDFYRFVKENPRSKGIPETPIAAVLGNCGSFVGLYIDWFSAFSQHAQARENRNWLYGDPERTDVALQQTLFPVPGDVLGEYHNSWLGGSPFGQCDVVNIDSETRLSDIKRYRFLAYSGWNTMTPEIMKLLRAYVEQGGTLFISLPHFSTRLDREYKAFEVKDLIAGGDLSELLDVKVTAREIGGGLVKSSTIPLPKGVIRKEPFAKIEAGANVKTIVSAGSRPLLVQEKIGKGEVFLMLGWEYPGKEAIAPYYKAILSHLADQAAGDVRVWEARPGDQSPRYIAYAVWPEAIYLLNTDCMKERTFIFENAGKKETITLKPTEFRTIRR